MTVIPETVKEKLQFIINSRQLLLQILQQPDLGVLRLDATQALEELEELTDELKMIFPAETL